MRNKKIIYFLLFLPILLLISGCLLADEKNNDSFVLENNDETFEIDDFLDEENLEELEINYDLENYSIEIDDQAEEELIRESASTSFLVLEAEDSDGEIFDLETKEEEKNFETYLVTKVIDGDTIEIETGDKIRYIGIDTPETVHPSKPVQCFGREAGEKNRELVLGKMVRLEKDITDRDKYNRLLRYVYIDDAFINLELVKGGYALSYTYPPDIKHQEFFLSAQRQARDQELGLWSACSGETATDLDSQCKIKGNISSEGKIYHLPGCESYEKTSINELSGERWFCSEAEALAAGWRKALNCN